MSGTTSVNIDATERKERNYLPSETILSINLLYDCSGCTTSNSQQRTLLASATPSRLI